MNNNKRTTKVIDDNIIRDLYVNKNMSSVEIAKQIGIISHSTILRHLSNIGIKARKNWKYNNESKLKGIKKSEEHKENMRKPKSKEGVKNITIARRKLAKEGRIEIANRLRGKTFEDIFGKEKALEIKDKIRKKMVGRKFPKHSEYMKLKNPMFNKETSNKMSGENSHKWLGGKSFEPYGIEFNKRFKLLIKQRDGFICFKCGMKEEDAKKLFKHNLGIHHIDYIKKNTFKENCCSLCCRCHSETSSNRNSWIKFFQSLLSERYGYKYTEIGELIININDLENKDVVY